jgi:hypothetical protein
LVQACLASYAETSGGNEAWAVRLQDIPKSRRADLKSSLNALIQIAGRLEYRFEGKAPLLWFAPDGELQWALYLAASAVAGQILLDNPYAARNSVFVLPEERTGLLAYKLARDPRLRQRVEEGWRFISFHRLNWLVEHPSLDQTVFEKALTTELADESGAQMRLF